MKKESREELVLGREYWFDLAKSSYGKYLGKSESGLYCFSSENPGTYAVSVRVVGGREEKVVTFSVGYKSLFPIKTNLEIGRKYYYGDQGYASGTFLGFTEDQFENFCFSPEDPASFFKSTQTVGGKKQLVVMFRVEPKTAPKEGGRVVTRSQMQELYKIACPKWKGLITHLTLEHLGIFEEEGVIPQKDIDAMFEAATLEQLPTLIEIFGEREEEELNEYRVSVSRIVTQGAMIHVEATSDAEARKKVQNMIDNDEISDDEFEDMDVDEISIEEIDEV